MHKSNIFSDENVKSVDFKLFLGMIPFTHKLAVNPVTLFEKSVIAFTFFLSSPHREKRYGLESRLEFPNRIRFRFYPSGSEGCFPLTGARGSDVPDPNEPLHAH